MQSILIAEHAALLSGNLHELEPIAERKERAAARLKRGHLTSAELGTLQVLARRNAELLDVVSQAIQTVRNLTHGQSSTVGTTAYGADGTRHALCNPASQFTQKSMTRAINHPARKSEKNCDRPESVHDFSTLSAPKSAYRPYRRPASITGRLQNAVKWCRKGASIQCAKARNRRLHSCQAF